MSDCSISLIILRYVGRLRAPVVMLTAWSVIQVGIISYLLQIILTLVSWINVSLLCNRMSRGMWAVLPICFIHYRFKRKRTNCFLVKSVPDVVFPSMTISIKSDLWICFRSAELQKCLQLAQSLQVDVLCFVLLCYFRLLADTSAISVLCVSGFAVRNAACCYALPEGWCCLPLCSLHIRLSSEINWRRIVTEAGNASVVAFSRD